jgi:hypothetical protein
MINSEEGGKRRFHPQNYLKPKKVYRYMEDKGFNKVRLVWRVLGMDEEWK